MSSLENKDSKTANLINPPTKQVKMVKIRAKYPIRINREGLEDIVSIGQTADVTEEEAKEFCDKEFNIGHKDRFGNLDVVMDKTKKVVRAERV